MGFRSWEQSCAVSWENDLAYETTIIGDICVDHVLYSVLRYP